MNGTHVAATGGITAMLAGVLVWATHLPLQPLDTATALDLAGLIVSLFGGGGLSFIQYRQSLTSKGGSLP